VPEPTPLPVPAPRREGPCRPLGIALLLAAILLPGAAAADGADAPWLRIDAPTAGITVRLPLVEVRGRATPYGASAHDLALVIDVSDSTVLPSGWDVDGDGPGGRTSPSLAARLAGNPELAERMATEDLDDCILMAELAAARGLLDRIDLRRDRVALVAFSDRARILAPLGTPREGLEAALDDLGDSFEHWLRGTNFGDAIGAAQRALGAENGPVDDGRQRSILFLSDGAPTLPPFDDLARQHALWAANAAAAAGIRIHAFALGVPADPGEADGGVFAALAARTGGTFERLTRAGDAIAKLPRTDLVGLAEVRFRNATTGQPGRAVRVFPDGSFDGFVELAPGANRVLVEAVASDGSQRQDERTVVRAPAADDAETRARLGELLQELRRRTRETELWAQMERERRAQSVERELRVTPAPPKTGRSAP
jgi:hypothetical protein